MILAFQSPASLMIAAYSGRGSGSEQGGDLPGRPLARAHGAVHVALPVVGGLGAGPVDAPDRGAQGRPVLAQRARAGDRRRAAVTPPLGRPVQVEVVDRVEEPVVAEDAGELGEDAGAALGR